MAQPCKGHDVAIVALRMCQDAGMDGELVLVGDGKERASLEALGPRLGVQGSMAFRGQLPAGDGVRRKMDSAQLFVMASRVEGLHLALIEAMDRALLCIGTSIGGIPELLPPEAIVPPDDATALAERIQVFHRDERVRRRMAQRNWEMARTYREAEVQPRREAFYRLVAKATEEWFERTAAARPS